MVTQVTLSNSNRPHNRDKEIRKVKITHALLGEHGAIRPLLDFIEQSASDATVEQIKLQVRLLQSTLVSHASIEDALLRPAIERYLPRPSAGSGEPLPSDHEIIRSGLDDVLACPDRECARTLLLATVAATRKHFQKEEKTVFGIAERELTEQEQERLGAEWATMRCVLLGETDGRHHLSTPPERGADQRTERLRCCLSQ
jgi:hemerythrin-like domain-containing protein